MTRGARLITGVLSGAALLPLARFPSELVEPLLLGIVIAGVVALGLLVVQALWER